MGLRNNETTPRAHGSHVAPARSMQTRSVSAARSPAVPLTSPSLSTPGASPWKQTEQTPAISFKSLQKEQPSQILSSTFPPSGQTSLPQRHEPAKTPVIRPIGPPSASASPNFVRRNSAAPTASSTTPGQIRSVPGKSFQERPVPTSPTILDMFPVLGTSPQNLADIIAQQTSEQAALNAKVTPRSLKEIQEEEQFLQWWEQESQRVQEEEQLLARTTQISMQDGRGRGRGSRGGARGKGARGRGRGDAKRGYIGKGQVHSRGK